MHGQQNIKKIRKSSVLAKYRVFLEIKADANFYFVMLDAVTKLFILIAVHFE